MNTRTSTSKSPLLFFLAQLKIESFISPEYAKIHDGKRYVLRVAISNRRLVKYQDDQVTFRYTTSDTRKTKQCTVTAEEFIGRFLHHVLPKGFVKVRYCGANFQISAASAKIVSGFWLETNSYPPCFCA